LLENQTKQVDGNWIQV